VVCRLKLQGFREILRKGARAPLGVPSPLQTTPPRDVSFTYTTQ
jgi:hypothetical protein